MKQILALYAVVGNLPAEVCLAGLLKRQAFVCGDEICTQLKPFLKFSKNVIIIITYESEFFMISSRFLEEMVFILVCIIFLEK